MGIFTYRPSNISIYNQTCFQVMGSSVPDNTDPSSCSMLLLKPSDGQTRVMVAFFFAAGLRPDKTRQAR